MPLLLFRAQIVCFFSLVKSELGQELSDRGYRVHRSTAGCNQHVMTPLLYTHVCILHTCVHARTHTHTYIQTYTNTVETVRKRETDRQTERQTDRHQAVCQESGPQALCMGV